MSMATTTAHITSSRTIPTKSGKAVHGKGRGFAAMSPEKKREIASKGGKAAHALGTAHKWTSEEAQAAGRKGGSISRRRSKYSVQA